MGFQNQRARCLKGPSISRGDMSPRRTINSRAWQSSHTQRAERGLHTNVRPLQAPDFSLQKCFSMMKENYFLPGLPRAHSIDQVEEQRGQINSEAAWDSGKQWRVQTRVTEKSLGAVFPRIPCWGSWQPWEERRLWNTGLHLGQCGRDWHLDFSWAH